MQSTSPRQPTPTKNNQVEKFKEAQRELETDQSQEHFDAILKKVAKAPKERGDKSKES